MPDRVKDDRPFITKWFTDPAAPAAAGRKRRESVGMPGDTLDQDVQLGKKPGGPLDGLKEAGKGLKILKEKGII